MRYFIVYFEANVIKGRDKLDPVRGLVTICCNGFINHRGTIKYIEDSGNAQDVRLTGINEISESDYKDFSA